MNDLEGKVAVVTGATRGAGRGIAIALGEAGATVYVTGRSRRGGVGADGLPGSVEETAEAVEERGGVGVAAPCDHTDDDQVEELFETVARDRERLDLLVANVWGGYEGYDTSEFAAAFWEQPVRFWDGMFTAGVRAHWMSARFAARLMLEQGSGLIVLTTAWDRDRYLRNLAYDVAKAAVNRMARGLAVELRPHGITAVAVAPGFMRTERVLAAHAQEPFDLGPTETPEYVGRVIAALAGDPRVARFSGRTIRAGDLARIYGVRDVDGRWIPPFEIPPDDA